MKRLTIIVPTDHTDLGTLASITGTYEIFLAANAFFKANHQHELFKIELAGCSVVPICDDAFSIHPEIEVSAIANTDLIIIPSMESVEQIATEENDELVKWLKSRYKEGAEIASICTGAFLLAYSGLLDGKSCSTHWSAANEFKKMFPSVNLQEHKLITDEYGLYTNGGSYSFLNLLIHLIEKHYDRATAIYCAKRFQIEMDRHNQSAFWIFTGQKLHDDETIKKAQLYIESNVEERISVQHLSSMLAIGRRSFDRRFLKATGNTPLEYTQRVKVEAAKKALETTQKNVNDVMYEVGYSDEKSFRELFKKITGISPLGYRNRYNRQTNGEH